ncbi:Ig-like domain-containing protein [Clostridium sp. JNZ X4-2]
MKRNIKAFIMTAFCMFMIFQFKVSADSQIEAPRINIDTNKEWTVKFNTDLDPSTVNDGNITVTDSKNNKVPVAVSIGSNGSTVLISPEVSGYAPGEKYYVTIGQNVESMSGKRLSNPLKMEFTTTNSYSDGTSYSELPNIVSDDFEFTPLLSSEKQGFYMKSDSTSDVQYRIFVNGQYDKADDYTELTDGYTSPDNNGKISSLKTLSGSTNGQKYKVVIYIKRTGIKGAHSDVNTDYDNYTVDYFRCVDSVDNENDEYINYNVSLNDMVNTQLNISDKAVFVETDVMNNAASKNLIKYYSNPNNFLDGYGKYQFLKLTYSDDATADSLNNLLLGKGILEDKGQAFLDAAKANNINVYYLVSHAMLETANGTSVLANGGAKNDDGTYLYDVPVYNFFGINAVDNSSVLSGTRAAYENGWTTPEAAISGGAKWISGNYINGVEAGQDTLYNMRWNPEEPGQHQYATDVSWAFKQISDIIKGIQNMASDNSLNLEFEIPRFKE